MCACDDGWAGADCGNLAAGPVAGAALGGVAVVAAALCMLRPVRSWVQGLVGTAAASFGAARGYGGAGAAGGSGGGLGERLWGISSGDDASGTAPPAHDGAWGWGGRYGIGGGRGGAGGSVNDRP
jgi:hypothetical protein